MCMAELSKGAKPSLIGETLNHQNEIIKLATYNLLEHLKKAYLEVKCKSDKATDQISKDSCFWRQSM